MRVPTRRPARLRPLVAALAVTLGAAACSGSSATSSDAPEATTSTGEASDDAAFPVTIEHLLGSSTIHSRPTRVAALGSADFDTVLALGVEPVVGVHRPGEPGTPFPWAEPEVDDDLLLVDPEGLETGAETILSLTPDLVLGTTANASEDDYRSAAELGVPVIGPISAPYQDTWQERTEAIGVALGLSEEATQLVADTEALIEEFAGERPGLAGKTFAMANSIGSGQIRVIASPTSSSARLLAELGMAIPEALTELTVEPDGAVTLSLEQLDLLDADVVLLTGRDGDLAAADVVTGNPTFEDLPAARRGTVLVYGRLVGTALRAPSPLAIPWVLDELDDVLTRTAAAPAVAG